MSILNLKFLIFLGGLLFVQCEDRGHFWHITDTHVDQNYSRSGNALNMCHKNPNIRRNNVDNGLYGNFLCDSPQYLINATILSMKYIQPTPDFIIWTGDNLPHSLDFIPDWDVTFEAIRNTTFMLRSSFPDITILPSIGNHDTFPPNILPTDTSANNIYKGYLEKGGWKDLIIENQWPTFVQGGYYSHLLKSGFRIISLNTILWYSPNNLTEKMPDPGNQFRWLEGLLKNSSRLSEKVYIIGHVPPGYYNRVNPGQKSDSTFHPQHLESYLKLLLKYSPVIVGQFYGHLHMDMFQVFQYDTGTFKGSSLLASSVTPWHDGKGLNVSIPVNPSVRLIHYSQADAELLDYDQYYLNLTKANSMKNRSKEQKNIYELLYTFTKAYDVPDLSTESLVKVYELLKNNQTIYNSFFTFLTAAEKTVGCDSSCTVAQLCSMSCISSSEYDMCFKNINNDVSVKHISNPNFKNSIVLYVSICVTLICVAVLFFIIYKKFWSSSSRSEYTPFSSF